MEQRNLLLAIVISVGILIGFQFLFERMRPVTPPVPTAGQSATPATPVPAPAAGPTASTTPGAASGPNAAAGTGAETREAAIAEQPRIKIDTPRLHGSIALIGGRIDDLTLATYHETVDPKSPEVVLLWPRGT